MASNQIKSLLDKYWEGETSLQEEQQLRAYFNGEAVAEDLKQYQPLFQFFKKESEAQLSDHFEDNLLQKIKADAPPKAVVRNLYSTIARVAAIGLLAFATYFAYSSLDSKTAQQANMIVYDDNPEDAKAAYIAYKDALKLVSRKMDKGSKKAAYGLGQVKKATSIIK